MKKSKRIMKNRAEITDKFVFFWGSYYSQWCHSPFEINGITFENAEKWMMYNKALTFGDTEIASYILKLNDPQHIKALGRKVRNFDAKKWAEVAYDIVLEGNIAKFSQNQHMLKELMETGDREIVEASPYDKIWGIGLGMQDPRRFDHSQWEGTNLLGKVLMDTREYFRQSMEW